VCEADGVIRDQRRHWLGGRNGGEDCIGGYAEREDCVVLCLSHGVPLV
jgi:hypothetical protein